MEESRIKIRLAKKYNQDLKKFKFQLINSTKRIAVQVQKERERKIVVDLECKWIQINQLILMVYLWWDQVAPISKKTKLHIWNPLKLEVRKVFKKNRLLALHDY